MSHIPHIMLIEDNEDDYEATARSFRDNHFVNPLQWCRSGQEALDYFSGCGVYAEETARAEFGAFLPDLVLLDLNMPGVDGRHVLAQMKKDERLKHIPVVILTTSSDHHDVSQCYALGASTYIQKPVSFDGLTRAVRAMKDYWFGVALLPVREGHVVTWKD